jgi:hypothetical protein
VKDAAKIDEKLFEKMPADLRRLNKRARQEERQKKREQYAREHGLK